MLNGIGGRTIAEAKERMSNDEFLRWIEYRRRHGTLNLGSRIEHGAAVTALAANRAAGGKAQLADYLPQRAAPAVADDEALTAAMAEWR